MAVRAPVTALPFTAGGPRLRGDDAVEVVLEVLEGTRLCEALGPQLGDLARQRPVL